MADRKTVLLKAAHDLLMKQHKSGYVLNLLEQTVFYDEADCDGHCLMEDIALELDLDACCESDGEITGEKTKKSR